MQISAHGVAIEVDDQGPTSGPVVLLIQGLGMQLTDWPQALVDDLVGRGHRVLRFDNRDAGLSQGFDTASLAGGLAYTLSDMVQDALGVLDALGVARAHVVGASMGGMIAQRLAAAHPQRVASLALLGTSARADTPELIRLRSEACALFEQGRVDEVLRANVAFAFHPDHQRDDALVQAYLAMIRRAGAAQLIGQNRAVMARPDLRPRLPVLRCPTLVAVGEADALTPPECAQEIAAAIPGARLHTIAGAGHMLTLEQAEAVTRLLLDWLSP